MDNRELIFCPRCGAVTSKYGSECRNCGYSLIEAEETSDYDTTSEESAEVAVEENIVDDTAVESAVLEQSATTEESSESEYIEETKVYYNEAPSTDPVVEKAEKKKKNLTWLWILLIIFPILILVGIIVVLVVALVFMTYGNFTNLTPVTPVPTPSVVIDDDDEGYGYNNFGPHIGDRRPIGDFDMNLYSSIASVYKNSESTASNDPFWANGDPDGIFGSHDMDERDTITGPYYEPFYESFDDSYGYSYERRYIKYSDVLNGIQTDADVAYYQFDGSNIPNLDELNEEIYYEQCYDFIQYLRGKRGYGETTSIKFQIDNYITYNDDEKISIVSNVDVILDGNALYRIDMYIYGINIDLKNGVVMYNPDIVDLDTIAGEFRDKSDKQNGVSDTLAAMTDEEIESFIKDKNSVIVFFTPVGLEVGFAYTYNSGGIGWITVSYDDADELFIYDYDNPSTIAIAPSDENSNTQGQDTDTGSSKEEDDPLADLLGGSDDL